MGYFFHLILNRQFLRPPRKTLLNSAFAIINRL
jgi:hypothetical protein